MVSKLMFKPRYSSLSGVVGMLVTLVCLGLAFSCAVGCSEEGSSGDKGGLLQPTDGGPTLCNDPPCGPFSDVGKDDGNPRVDVRPSGKMGEVLSMAGTEGNVLWVGTLGGLARLDLESGKVSWYHAEGDGLRHDEVVAVAVDGDGSVWVAYGEVACPSEASLRCGLSRLDPVTDQWAHFTEESAGLLDDRVFALLSLSQGGLLAGTRLGALTFKNGVWGAYFDWSQCLYAADHCTPLWSVNVGAISEAPDGSTWYAIDSMVIGITPKPGGVAHRSIATLTNTWALGDGLPANRAEDIVVGEAGVWASSHDGIAYLPPVSHQWIIEEDVETYALAIVADASVWAATVEGVMRRDGEGNWNAWTPPQGALPPGVQVLTPMADGLCFGGENWVDCYSLSENVWIYSPAGASFP